MNNPWQVEAWRVGALLVAAGLMGWMTSHLALSLVLFLAGYLVYLLVQLRKMFAWLESGNADMMPEGQGLVGSIAYQIYQIRKRDRKRKIRLAELLERFRKSTAALPDGTVVLSVDNQIDWFNKAAGELLGLKTSDIGQPIGNLVRHPRFTEYLEHEGDGGAVTISSPLDEKSALELRIVPYGEGLRLLLARDITRIVQIQQMRRDFIANASHELRTPLTVIRGYLEMLSRDAEEGESSLNNALGKISYQVGRMQHLVDDLLTLSRMEEETKKSIYGTVRMSTLLDDLKSEAMTLATEKQHTVTLERGAEADLRADEKELRSAFGNLISNAVHYTKPGGIIAIRWYLTPHAAIFEVQDSGVGIAPEHIPRLVERFYRVNKNASLHRQGTGLGLAIVKHVLEHYDARLEIDSQIGKGSTFRCRFPLSCVESEPVKAVI